MKITSVRCEGYKPFHAPTELSFAPLTLVFGHNTSGKSALARLPRLVLRAMAGGLDLSIGTTRYGESFLDLVHGRDMLGAMRLGLTLERADQSMAVDATWRNLYSPDSGNTQFVSRIAATGAGSLDLTWDQGEAPGAFVDHGGDPIPLLGMLPKEALPDTDLDPSVWRKAAEDAERELIYLGPHRKGLHPSYAQRNKARLGDDGSGAPHWLRADAELAADVGAWYAANLGTRLEVDPQGEGFRLIVREGAQVLNAVELGEGAQQALPVVTLLFAMIRAQRPSSLVIIEQPELHLHDAAQGALADLLLRAAKASGPILIETHSELTLLRVRRRIAEQKETWSDLNPPDVAIYWVEREGARSTSKRVEVAADGWVDDWPRTVYDVTFQEVAALQRAVESAKP